MFNTINNLITALSQKLVNGRISKLIVLVFLLFTVAIMARLVWGNWDVLNNYEWQIRPIWLIAIILFFAIDLYLATFAWHLLVARLANFNNFRRSAKICWYANLARRIPTPVWYIAGRAVLYEQEGVSKLTISLLSALEIVFFLISGLITTLLTLPFWVLPPEITHQLGAGKASQFLLLFVFLILSLVLVHPKILEWIWRKLASEPPTQHLVWKDTITWLCVYISTWVFGAFIFFSIINLIHPLPLSKIVSIIGIWSFAGSISLSGSLTISFIGLREVSLTLLLAQLIPSPIALIVAILVRIVWVAGELLSSLASLKL